MYNSFEQPLRHLRPGVTFQFKDTTKPDTGVYECVTVGPDPRNREYMMYIHKNIPDDGIKRIHGDEKVLTETHINSYDEKSPRVTTIGSLLSGTVVLIIRKEVACVTAIRKIIYKDGTTANEVSAVVGTNGETYDPFEKVRILYSDPCREYKRLDELTRDQLFQIRDSRLLYSPWNTYGLVRISWEGGVSTRWIRKYDYTLDNYEGPEIKLVGDIVVLKSVRTLGASRRSYGTVSYGAPATYVPPPDPVYEDILIETLSGNKEIPEYDQTCGC